MRPLFHTTVLVLAGLLLAACSGSPPSKSPPAVDLVGRPGTAGVFPRPAELEPQVAFWRNVYGVWSRSQVAVHDDRYLGVVYEVIELPGDISEGYDGGQQALVREQRDLWRYRLRTLATKTASGEALTPAEQQWAARLTQAGGRSALFGASERVRTQRGLRERFKRGVEISGRYDATFRHIFRQHGLPEDLAYLPHVESSFQAHARSSAGAVGIWQFTRGAARAYMNVSPGLDERLDPVASARGAARYLRDAYSKLGAWPLAITSYNHGIGGMQRARSLYGTDITRIVREYDHPLFGFASRNFYTEFLAAREVASQPHRFFPEGVRYEPPLNQDRISLQQPLRASDLASYYGLDRSTLLRLNPAWTEVARADQVALPEGTDIWLPAGTLNRMASLGKRREPTVALTTPPAPWRNDRQPE